MTTDFRAELQALVDAYDEHGGKWPQHHEYGLFVAFKRARATLAQAEPKRRYIYNPVQIAECGGPCEQGPEHCDCGELWLAEPEPEGQPPAEPVAWMYRGEPEFDGTAWRENWEVTTSHQLAVFKAQPNQPVPLVPAAQPS